MSVIEAGRQSATEGVVLVLAFHEFGWLGVFGYVALSGVMSGVMALQRRK